MKILTALVSLILSFNVMAEDVPQPEKFENPGALVSLGLLLDTLSEGNPLSSAGAMLYISGSIDSFRMLKVICPNPDVKDADLISKSLGALAAAASYVMADPERIEENLALPASFYILSGLVNEYPCPEEK